MDTGVLSDEDLRERLAALQGAATAGPADSNSAAEGSTPSAPAKIEGVGDVLVERYSPNATDPPIGTTDLSRKAPETQGGSESQRPQSSYRYIKPLSDAADSLLEVWTNTEGRFMFGLRPIDLMTRGIGRGQLCYITGRSHSGKTQLFLNAVLHDRRRPLVLFTLDETQEEVLAKLYCMATGRNLEEVERDVAAGDPSVSASLTRMAREDLGHLLVFDDVLSLDAMSNALDEARSYFQRDIAAVCIDYLGLLSEGDEFGDVAGKSKALKRWTKQQNMPVLCIHQGSRANSGKGQSLGMEAMTHAGENEATFVLGVRRLRDDTSLDEAEREREKDTVNVAVIKNKRPPSRRGERTFILDPDSGVIREPTNDEVGMKFRTPYVSRSQIVEATSGLR